VSKAGGGWNADLAANTRSLVALYKSTKQFDKACELLEATLRDVKPESDGLPLPFSVADDVAGMMKDLAELYKLLGRKDDVVSLLSQVRRCFVCAHVSMVDEVFFLHCCSCLQACNLLGACVEVDHHNPKLLSLQSALGWAYAATGEFEQCIAALAACAQAKEAAEGSASTSYADALVNLGRACKIAGDAARAVSTLERAVKVYEACGHADSSQALEAKESYIDALIAAGQTDNVVALKAECETLRSALASNGSSTPRASFSVQPRRPSGVSVK
jgi:tetratricopeptide (TPR) repeat protein